MTSFYVEEVLLQNKSNQSIQIYSSINEINCKLTEEIWHIITLDFCYFFQCYFTVIHTDFNNILPKTKKENVTHPKNEMYFQRVIFLSFVNINLFQMLPDRLFYYNNSCKNVFGGNLRDKCFFNPCVWCNIIHRVFKGVYCFQCRSLCC